MYWVSGSALLSPPVKGTQLLSRAFGVPDQAQFCPQKVMPGASCRYCGAAPDPPSSDCTTLSKSFCLSLSFLTMQMGLILLCMTLWGFSIYAEPQTVWPECLPLPPAQSSSAPRLPASRRPSPGCGPRSPTSGQELGWGRSWGLSSSSSSTPVSCGGSLRLYLLSSCKPATVTCVR